MRKDVRAIFQTDIYGITCEALTPSGDNLAVVSKMIEAGIKIIQYREKEKTKREKYRQCQKIARMCEESGVLFIVNDDVDIAMLCRAGGVHLGQEDLPAAEVRRLVGPDMIIGVSADKPCEVEDARQSGADYVGVGPVFGTATKPDAGEPVGLCLVEQLAKNCKIPLVAIGGITAENIADVRRRGITCCAMISDLVRHADLPARVELIRRRLSEQDQNRAW